LISGRGLTKTDTQLQRLPFSCLILHTHRWELDETARSGNKNGIHSFQVYHFDVGVSPGSKFFFRA
jgi:hypothetical protein